jgi:hypothetical protein
VIMSAEDQANQPDQSDADDMVGALVQAIGVQGVLVVLALAALWLLKYAAVRRLAARAIRRLSRALVRYVRLSLYALRMRIPTRLAYRLQPERWRSMTEARKLTGLKRGRIRRTPMGVDVRVTLGGALTLETLQARVKDLETGLGVRRARSASRRPTWRTRRSSGSPRGTR